MNPTFRPGNPADRAFFNRLSRECFPEADRFRSYQVRRFLENPAGSILAEVLEHDGADCGFAVWITRKGESWVRLYALCVDAAHRGKGAAKTYLSEKLAELSKRYDRALLEVRLDNENAIALYESLGFRKDFIFRDYYRDQAPAHRMVLKFDRNQIMIR